MYFMIYSFLGWCLEVIYHGVSKGIVVNGGFLNGPACPIYGVTMICIFAMVQDIPCQMKTNKLTDISHRTDFVLPGKASE